MGKQVGESPDDRSKRHTMSHPPPHIPGLDEPPGSDGLMTNGSSHKEKPVEVKTQEKKEKVSKLLSY